MSELVVQSVVTRRQKRQFLQFPWTLYRGDPYWVPPLRRNQEELVGYRSHPFYDRNLVQTFIACRDGEVCGRIAAILNYGHIQQHDDRRGFFGFFECIDDQAVADGLFDAVGQWFADQGIYKLRGPTNPSQNHELGLLIDGFDSTPFFMMTYNPPYYERLIEGYGFRKSQDLYAYWGHIDMLPKIQEKLAPIAEQIIEHYNVRLRPLDRSRFLEDVEAFLSIYNRSLANTWGFVPMSHTEVQHMARGLQRLIVPELAIAAEIDDRIVGAVFALPDYNPRIKQIDGRLFPFGFMHLLRNKHRIKRMRLLSTNVVPEYQRMGIGLALMHGVVPKVLQWGIEEAEFSWVLESNSLSRGSLKKGGAKITKTYRLYDLDNEPAADGKPSANTTRQIAVRTASEGGPLEICRVRTRFDLDRFIKVPWRIYAEDPQWVPPLMADVKEFLNPRKHPFYTHGNAVQFIATRDGVPIGRILASDDSRYNQQRDENVGCFGMFECIDDRRAAGALLDAADDWLRNRGRSVIRGPIDYSTNYPCGLLVDGFYTPPRVMMNHNRPYYAELLESWGLAKAKDIYAWWFDDSRNMIDRWRNVSQRLAKRSKVIVRPFRQNDFDAEVQRCREIYNQSMHNHWGFVALTDVEFRYMAKRLSQLAIADLILIAELDGRPVGCCITLPDLNEAIRPLDGRLTRFGIPIGLSRLAYRLRHVKTARMIVLDVLEGYRRRGIAEMMILRTLDYGKNTLGYTSAELSWTDEDNKLVNRTIETVGGQRYKTYRIYERGLGIGV